MSTLQYIIDRYGWRGIARLPFYPLTALITTPIRLVQTLWACRILADGKGWREYTNFQIHKSISYLFYWTRGLILYQFGRHGHCPYIGLGKYSMSNFSFYSLPSLYIYCEMGVVAILFGMFGWCTSNLIWIHNGNILWILIVMSLALVSTTFYTNTFGLQNYNVLGWIFFPLGLYGMCNGNWLLCGFAWFAASFCSFTVVFLAGILLLALAFSTWSIIPIYTILPASLKFLTHIYPNIFHGSIKTFLLNTVKAIGMTNRNVKYKYKSKKFGKIEIYFLIIYGQFLIVTYLITGNISILYLTGLILFILNSKFSRFADKQTIQMLIFSLATVLIFQHQELWLLPSYWIVISPLPFFTGFNVTQNVLDVVPKLAPFSVKDLKICMKEFLSSVEPGKRILMAFEDPGCEYEKMFDGYGDLLELPYNIAAQKRVHLMPDWCGVFELNYEGAPDFWGRNLKSVIDNVAKWKADYVFIYQTDVKDIEKKWLQAGFEVISKFDWEEKIYLLNGVWLYHNKKPIWWLLKAPNSLKDKQLP